MLNIQKKPFKKRASLQEQFKKEKQADSLSLSPDCALWRIFKCNALS